VKTSIAPLINRGGAVFRSERTREALSVAFVIGLAALMLHPIILRGDWPVGHDHPVHIARLALVKAAILEHGTPWVWSHDWFAGFPLNVTYPIGADLFVLAVHALSLGMLKLEHSYAVAFLLFYALFGYGCYFFVKAALGSRLAAVVAVLFLLTDPGNSDVGGWFWFVDAGVWTAALGSVPALIGTVRLADLFAAPSRRTAAAFAICLGLAVLCHPLHLIYFALAVPLLVACRYIVAADTAWKRALLLGFAGGVCGLLIACVWLVPFFWSSEYVAEIGSSGATLTQMGEDLAGGRLFSRMLPLAAAFGFASAVFLLRARAVLPLFMALMVFICLTFASSSVPALFGPAAVKWVEEHIVVGRFLMLLKPFWFGAAAYLLVVSARALRTTTPGVEPAAATGAGRWLRSGLLVVLVGVFAAPLLFMTVKAFVKHEVLRPTRWHSEREDLAARAELIEWLRKEAAGDKRFFRIGHGFEGDNHEFSELALALPFPFFKESFTPTGHFKYGLFDGSAAALRATNVRFVIASKVLRRPDLRLLRSFGDRLHVHGFGAWNPQPFEVLGGGEVVLRKFTGKEIELHAKPGAHGQLRLNVSYYPKWRATRDRIPVPITPVPLPNIERSMFMQVRLEPGTYRFRYHKHPVDYLGALLCIGGLTGCGFLAFGDRLPQNRVFTALRGRFAFVNRSRVSY
jgi:hypothetical protein